MNQCAGPPNYSGCNLHFADDPSFDAHRVGTHEYTYWEGLKLDPPREDGRRCLSVEEMVEAGWTKNRFDRWRCPEKKVREPLVARVKL